MTRLKKLGLLALSVLMASAMLAPGSASALKIANPSPPDFYGELTGGFLQLSGAGGTKIFQLSLDFEQLGLSRPTFRGTVNSSGDIFVPQAQLVFPPLSFDIPPDTVNLTLLPTAPATGKIDPLTGRVDFRVRLRIQGTGVAQGVSLGGSCFVGSAANPIDIDGRTHAGVFPDATALYEATFLPDNAGFLGGTQTGQAYSDEPGVWPIGPTPLGGPNPIDVPRVAGSFRVGNDTLRAVGASGCGPLGLANGPLNDAVGLPSDVNGSTAVLDFAFVAGGSRVGPNALVQKGVKSNFIAPGVSTNTWPSTEVPVLPTTVPATINASTSVFSGTPNAGGRYAFDLGTGSFGAFTNTASQPISFATPGIRTIRVRARDADGDIDTKTRQINVVPSTDISVTNSVVGGEVRGGSNGVQRITVTNQTATRSNTQPIVLTTSLPAGTTFTSTNAPAGWVCGFSAPTVTCTLPTGSLAASASSVIDVNFSVAPGAVNPLSSTAQVVQSGDPNTANDSSNISIPVRKTDLSVAISHSGDVVANGKVTLNLAVSNVGDAATVGESVVSVTLPPALSYRNAGSGGSGWACVSGPTPQDVTCTRSSVLAAATSAPALAVVAKVDRTANGMLNVDAAVAAQGDTNAFGGSDTDSDVLDILVLPDLAIESSLSGDFIVGDPGQVTFKVTAESVVPVNGPTTVTSTLPSGLTVSSISGSGWDCSATTPGTTGISCFYAATLAAAEVAPDLVATIAVDHAAYPGVSIDSALSNVDDAVADNNAASSAVTVKRLDVNINKSAVRSFSVGIEGQYRLSVSNVGDAATVGQIKVVDELPAELKLAGVSGGGWNCSASVIGQQHVECVINSSIVAGSGAPVITVRVDVLDAAADAGEVTNTATVDTTRDDRAIPGDSPVSGNNSSTAITKAVSVDLSVESTHGTAFRTGTSEQYSLKIRNVGSFGTVVGKPVTVVDELPAGMVPDTGSIWTDRPGWDCASENLGTVSSPLYKVTCILEAPDLVTSAMVTGATATIEIPVYIGDTAVSASNVAEVSTEKDSSVDRSPNNRSEDPTTVTRIDLKTTASQSIAPRAAGIGEVSVGVENIGTAATSNPTVVVVPLKTGVSYRPTGSTIAGWQCASPGAGTQVTCTRLPSIAAGASAPPLKVRSNVSTSAPASWTTDVTVRTTGELSERLGNNDVSFGENLEKIDLAMRKSHIAASIKAGAHGEYKLSVENVGNTASTGTTTVTETVSPDFGSPLGVGPGWSCQTAGQNLTCTRTASILPGATTPPITVGFNVAINAAGTRNTTATLANSSDPYPANNSASDPILIVATADIALSIDQPAAMRVGEVSSVSYRVRNVGTDSTSGDPSVKLKVTMPENLEPVGYTSTDAWDCSQSGAVGPTNAYFDCSLATELAPGASSTLQADVRPLPSSEVETGTLGRITSAGDVNRLNDVDSAISSLTGIDLKVEVASPLPSEDDFEAGVTKKRAITVSNVGTSATSGTTRVKVPLPNGMQWTESAGTYGSGWLNCSMPVRTIICERNDVVAAASSLPVLTLGLRASRSNADSVSIDYIVETIGDGIPANNTANRVDTVLYKPDTTFGTAPSGTTTSKSANITFTSDDPAATFECSTDAGDYAACTSPVSFTGLSLGGHSLAVRAKNVRGMVDASPAEANWTVIAAPLTGEKSPLKSTLTSGNLSLATLGAVDLPAEQLIMDGFLYNNGGWEVPQAGVNFKPVEQVIDAPGIGRVTVKISISATGPGVGKLTNGGGDATFNLPVQAKLEASVFGVPLIGPDADCALRPISFDLTGTYDEAGQTATVSSAGVSFPKVSAGCGALGNTVNDLLELPRSDIGISLTFGLVKSVTTCPDGLVGTPPDCVEPPVAILGKPAVKAAKKVKSGKPVTIKVKVANTGGADASAVKVCLTLKKAKKLAKGKAKRCKTVASIAAGGKASTSFQVKTKKIKTAKAKLNFSVDASAPGLVKPKNYTGHVTLNR